MDSFFLRLGFLLFDTDRNEEIDFVEFLMANAFATSRTRHEALGYVFDIPGPGPGPGQNKIFGPGPGPGPGQSKIFGPGPGPGPVRVRESLDNEPGSTLEDVSLTKKNAFIIHEDRELPLEVACLSRTEFICGLCGLSNLDDTCFMNSALTKYFLSNESREHINHDNSLRIKDDVAIAYGKVIQILI
ncbi:unnamed protein product [Rotaria sp. Silwood1]|nr:unnamed protein product [Rotaria sp. Silwood1]